jgi:nitronate monooxygenase
MRAEERALPPYPVQNWLMQQFRKQALAAGRTDMVSLWSGQGAPLLKHRRARVLMEALISESGALLGD